MRIPKSVAIGVVTATVGATVGAAVGVTYSDGSIPCPNRPSVGKVTADPVVLHCALPPTVLLLAARRKGYRSSTTTTAAATTTTVAPTTTTLSPTTTAPAQTTTTVRQTTTTTAPGASTTVPPVFSGTINSLARIVDSMDWPHAGCPHGVPTYYSWQSVPEVDDATDASAQPLTIPWGQIYADCTATEPTNVRIELRNIEEWLWSKSQSKWVEVATSPTVNGGHFSECFCGSDGPQPNWRQESDGGISSTMVAGYNLHFWTTAGRVPIQLPASGIGAVYSTFEARLILDDPTGPNNLAQAKYLANAGADWWSANGAQNPSPGMGRFTYLTTSWQAEDFYTGSGPDNTYGPSAYPPGWTNLQLEAFAPPITG